jgi:hypothetical protein
MVVSMQTMLMFVVIKYVTMFDGCMPMQISEVVFLKQKLNYNLSRLNFIYCHVLPQTPPCVGAFSTRSVLFFVMSCSFTLMKLCFLAYHSFPRIWRQPGMHVIQLPRIQQ